MNTEQIIGKNRIVITQGSNYKITVELYYSTGVRFADPLATVKAYAKYTLSQQNYDIELTGHYTNSSEGPVWVFLFTPDMTKNLTPGWYYFEIRVDGTEDNENYSYVALDYYENDFVIEPTVFTEPVVT